MDLFDILAKASMRLSAPKSQTFTDGGYSVVDAFDTVVMARGNMVANPVTNTITVPVTAYYRIRIGINFDARATEELQVMPYVNGVAYSSNPISIQAKGVNKPTEAFWESDTGLLTAGDVIDIRGQNGDSGDIDVDFTRTTFAVTKDS